MFEAVNVMARVREEPALDKRIEIFSDFLKCEFRYDGFTYGVGFDFSSMGALLSRFMLKENGLCPEWMRQYTTEALGAKDLSVLHVALRDGVLLQSRVFRAADDGDIPDHFTEVPNRARDYVKSGFFLSLRGTGPIGGMGLHSSDMTPAEHDARFARHGRIVVELCRQFHDMANWRNEAIAATGLTEANLKVLQLRAQGLADKAIIEITGHAHENSVVQHMERVRRKLNARNERQALRLASGLGLIGTAGSEDWRRSDLDSRARLLAQEKGWLGRMA
jgi:DNA-binding CsgD family transcriptional regulator